MHEDDFILRQIQRFTDTVAQVLRLEDRGELTDNEETLDDAYTRLLPLDRALFETLDAKSLVPLLGDAYRVAAIAAVQAAEGDLHGGEGRYPEARRCYHRALILLEHASRTIVVDDSVLEALRRKLAGAARG